MTKAQFISAVQAKKGFVSIIKDALAPDHINDDPIEKRYLYINHTNADGTMGKTYVYYLHDVANDAASFYNVETEALDIKEPNTENKKYLALRAYLKANFAAFFLVNHDLDNNWAEAEVFTLSGSDLTRSRVIVYKQGSNPIAHKKIV